MTSPRGRLDKKSLLLQGCALSHTFRTLGHVQFDSFAPKQLIYLVCRPRKQRAPQYKQLVRTKNISMRKKGSSHLIELWIQMSINRSADDRHDDLGPTDDGWVCRATKGSRIQRFR